MENTSKKFALFASSIISLMKGETDEVKALKIARKCLSHLEGQVSSLKATLVDREDDVLEAEENLVKAMFPVEVPSNGSSYITGLRNAEEAVEYAKDRLTNTQESIDYYQGLIDTKF